MCYYNDEEANQIDEKAEKEQSVQNESSVLSVPDEAAKLQQQQQKQQQPAQPQISTQDMFSFLNPVGPSATFVTQLSNLPKIKELKENYFLLQNTILELDKKVDTVIERHEAEFLLAYRQHMAKIKKELQDIKRKTDEQEKSYNEQDKISALEKQLQWFREECLKLYGKLEVKTKEIEEFRLKMQEQEKDRLFLEGQVKALLKKSKYLEVKLLNSQTNGSIGTGGGVNNTQLQQQHYSSSINNNQMFANNNSINTTLLNMQEELSMQNAQIANNLIAADNNNAVRQTFSHQQQQNNLTSLQVTSPNQDFNVNTQGNNIAQTKGTLSPKQYARAVGGGNIQCQTVISGELQHSLEESYPYAQAIIQLVKKFAPISDQVSLCNEVVNLLKQHEERNTKQIKILKGKCEKVLREKLRMNVVRSDLENFFLECVETVRRQIIKRKYMQKDADNLNYYQNEIKDYNIFRVEDKIKILELLVSNEKVLIFLYQKIFPSQFNLYLQTAIDKEQQAQARLIPLNQPKFGLPNLGGQNYMGISNNGNNLSMLDGNTQNNNNNKQQQNQQAVFNNNNINVSMDQQEATDLLRQIEEVENEGSTQIGYKQAIHNQNKSFDIAQSRSNIAGSVGAGEVVGGRARNSSTNKKANSSYIIENNQKIHPQKVEKRVKVGDKIQIQNGKLVFRQGNI